MEAATNKGINEFLARKERERGIVDVRLSNFLDSQEEDRLRLQKIFFDNLNKEVEQTKNDRINKEQPKNHVFHYWANSRSGIVLSGSKYNPCKKGKTTYLGFSSEPGWPKKMNTGRIIYNDPHGSPASKKKKNKKL